MNLQDAESLAIRLIREHLDSSWSFRWNRRQRAFGLCNYTKKTIELSRVLTETETEYATRQTILHEIAHAIAGIDAGHGPKWKFHARQLGVEEPKSRRAPTGGTKPNYKWAIKYDGKIVKGYLRRPNRHIQKNISNFYLRDRPETWGQLYIERVA